MTLIRDYLGNEFEPFPSAKIVSLVPSITETLFELGIGDRIVGVTRYCIHPEEATKKPKVGGTKSPNLNRIIQLKPDIIIANVEENPKDRIEELMKFSEVFVTYPRTVQESLEMIEDLSILLLGQIPLKIKNMIQRGLQLLKRQPAQKFNTFCPIWKNPWMTISSDTFIHDLLSTTGFLNVFSNKPERYPKISVDEILEKDIDVVLLPSEPYKFSEEEVLELREFKKLENLPMILFDGSLASWFGTRTIKGLEFFFELNKNLITNQ